MLSDGEAPETAPLPVVLLTRMQAVFKRASGPKRSTSRSLEATHRLAGAMSLRTASACCPQPIHVLPRQTGHVSSLHIPSERHFTGCRCFKSPQQKRRRCTAYGQRAQPALYFEMRQNVQLRLELARDSACQCRQYFLENSRKSMEMPVNRNGNQIPA